MFKLEVAAAYALPLASSARMVLPDNPVNQVEPENVARVVEEFENVLLPENVLLFASRVEDAAVMVLLSPKLNAVPLIVTDEFCSALLGKLSDELAIWYSVPLFAPMKPVRVASTGVLVNVCVPPHVFDVEVPKARENMPVTELYWAGYVAESDARVMYPVSFVNWEIFEEAKFETVRPETVRAFPTFERPEPRRFVNVCPLMPKLVVVALAKSALAKWEVEEANTPPVNARGVEVAFTLTP
jgi:hypothetical protein